MRTTTRRVALATAALAGAAVGVIVTMALTDPTAPRRAASEEPQLEGTSSSTELDTTTTTAPFQPDALLVWTSGGLPPGFDAAVGALDGVTRMTMVRGDETAMTASSDASGQPVDVPAPGWHLPLDTLAIEPKSFLTFLSGDARSRVRSLGPGEALLTESSAALRRLGPGATIRLHDRDVQVAGVIDDQSGASAELIVPTADAEPLGVVTPRYLLVAYTGEREALQRAIALLGGGAVRFRSPAETTWLRHGDAVEPPLLVKQTFGEFAVRDRSGRDVEIDPAWVERWIVTESVPILGSVTCHRMMFEPLRAAMEDLEQAGLAHLVDPSDYAGCFAPRRIASGQPLSHHAWGAALDLNVDGNPRGSFSTQDPRLVETMLRHGFTWGGTWLVPDPAHYEAPI